MDEQTGSQQDQRVEGSGQQGIELNSSSFDLDAIDELLVFDGFRSVGRGARTARGEKHSGRAEGLEEEEHAHPGWDEDEGAHRQREITHREQAHEAEAEEKQQNSKKQSEATVVLGDIRGGHLSQWGPPPVSHRCWPARLLLIRPLSLRGDPEPAPYSWHQEHAGNGFLPQDPGDRQLHHVDILILSDFSEPIGNGDLGGEGVSGKSVPAFVIFGKFMAGAVAPAQHPFAQRTVREDADAVLSQYGISASSIFRLSMLYAG